MQKLSLHLREDASPALIPWDAPLIDPGEEQDFHVFQTASLHISHQYLIGSRGDQPHLHLRQSRVQQFGIFFQRDPAVSQQHDQLVKQIHDHPVDLRVLPGSGRVALSVKPLFLFLQLFLNIQTHQTVIERFGHAAHIPVLPGQLFFQSLQPAGKAGPDLVQRFQISLFHMFQGALPFPSPAGQSADASGDHIILQPVRLFAVRPRHPAPQQAEHGFIGKILLDSQEQGAQKFHKGIFQYVPLPVHESRDSQPGKALFQQRHVAFLVSRYHGDVPVAESLVPHQAQDLSSDLLGLRSGIPGGKKTHFLRLFLPDRSFMAEYMLFHKMKRRSLMETVFPRV